MARLAGIWIKRARRGPMDPSPSARLLAGRGIAGNADFLTPRQVTIVAAERWREAEAELGRPVDPVARRANLLVEGIDLRENRGRRLRVGAVRLLVRGETRPCERMDEAAPGLRAALSRDWRAGAWGEILDDGEIAVGDFVAWDENEP
jgi:MOSC domain-containing protein YiiM